MLIRRSNIPVSLDAMLPENSALLRQEVTKALDLKANALKDFKITRKSVDARKKSNVHFVVSVEARVAGTADTADTAGEGAPDAVSPEAAALHVAASPKPASPAAPVSPTSPTSPAAPVSPTSHTSPAAPVSPTSHASPAAPVSPTSPTSPTNAFLQELPRPIVVGAGPAGLFCALRLAQCGRRPIIIERGEAVDERKRSVDAFLSGESLNPNSNVQFGEGGAGTFSDGKLNTGKNDPRIRYILETFAAEGAPTDILVDAKPHIGTDNLPHVVRNLRQKIISLGGEFRFNTQLVMVELDDGTISGARLKNLETGDIYTLATHELILAIGHSARDTFEMLHAADFKMERKSFAVGVRIEHSQSTINKAQYGHAAIHPALPPADYKLNVRVSSNSVGKSESSSGSGVGKSESSSESGVGENGVNIKKESRGVYTFCMCPGGSVVAAASEEGGVCLNGMSTCARDGKNANSALLVEIYPDDLPGESVLAGIEFQRELERAAYELGYRVGGKPYMAPAQRVGSFLGEAGADAGASKAGADAGAKKASADACACANESTLATKDTSAKTKIHPTYVRGLAWTDLHKCLPPLITNALEKALPRLDSKLHGFACPDAIMCAVEARSSSPVRILRDKKTLESLSAKGVYPAGEGAGYAGGIMSAAIDGLRVAESIERSNSSAALSAVAQALSGGFPIVFPTDTVVGLGISTRAAKSPAILAAIKNRAQDKPIAWLVDSLDALDIYGEDVPAWAYELAAKNWPGGCTLVVKASAEVPEAFQSAQKTIGLRMPNSPMALALIELAKAPLATTSANLAGKDAPATIARLDDEFLEAVRAAGGVVLAGGDAPAGGVVLAGGDAPQPANPQAKPSTVIDCTGAAPKILRS